MSAANGGFVYGDAVSDWRNLDLRNLRVALEVNGKVVDERNGGHPTGDSLGVAVALELSNSSTPASPMAPRNRPIWRSITGRAQDVSSGSLGSRR